MKVLITGTHFTPAQAVIGVLKEDPQVEIVYVGRKTTLEGEKTKSVESTVLPELGVKFIPITAGRFRRYFSFLTLISLIKVPFGFIQAFYILVTESPDVILSFGGYVGFPLVFCGWLLNIPVILHEQTLVSGLSNTLSSYFADKVGVSFDHKYGFDKGKIILTGNPLRSELFLDEKELKISSEVKKFIADAKKRKKKVILVTGGNQGSHFINEKVFEGFEELTKLACLIHQTGDSKFLDYEKLSERKDENYFVKKWIDVEDWVYILKNTDLAISRAGANTLAEFSLYGLPALLIPLPNLYKDEQKVNADFFADLGLATKIDQRNLTKERFISEVRRAFEHIDNLKRSAEGARKVVIKAAARRLALETKLLAERDE